MYQIALKGLAAFFAMKDTDFKDLPKQAAVDWYRETTAPRPTDQPYHLRNWQHRFLIGQPYEVPASSVVVLPKAA